MKTLRRHYRLLLCGALVVFAVISTMAFPRSLSLDGLLFDLMVTQRALLAPGATSQEPVAIVAIDQRSLEADELAAMPRALFAPYWARLTDALFDAGAQAVGFDVIFAWSAGTMQPRAAPIPRPASAPG